MKQLDDFRPMFELALVGLLNNWRVWFGEDELKAMHIGFDISNTEISVSLLTDREPYLEEQEMEPFDEPWPTADWRLTSVNETANHMFPDIAPLFDWLETQANALDEDELDDLNKNLKAFIFSVATNELVIARLKKFTNYSKPLKIRVASFFDSEPLDFELQ